VRGASASSALLSGLLIASLSAAPTLATSVTPVEYNRWHQGQAVSFMWKGNALPPAWLRPAIVAATGDAGSTTAAQAASFELVDSASSWIGYTDDVCTEAAIGCAWNNAPTSFTIRLRPQGWSFDWGTLRWCQYYANPPDGCFDAEMITLHELGHVQGLGHIEDAADPGTWTDSIMHAVSRAKHKTGWNAHAFGPCDVAALQALYQPATSSTLISNCLSLATTATLSAPLSVGYRSKVTLTATLAIASDVGYARLRGLPLSDRVVVLQYRSINGGSWITLGPLAPTAIDGEYATSVTLTNTYDWRARFAAPADEGLLADSSSVLRVTVGSCATACPAGVQVSQLQ
jgi:hypothetical protein